jgi:hypothetical protein
MAGLLSVAPFYHSLRTMTRRKLLRVVEVAEMLGVT